MRPTHIYGLADPRTGHVRYVGKTIDSITKRLGQHVYLARKKPNTHCARWIASLLSDGAFPEVFELELVGDDWREAEQFWIANLRAIGCDLVNHAIGGDGCNGYRHSTDAKERIGAAWRGKKRPPETIEKMRARIMTPEHCLKISQAKKGKVVISEEQRARISATLRGHQISEETRAKLRARGFTEEQRRKLSEAAKRQWAAGKGWSQK